MKLDKAIEIQTQALNGRLICNPTDLIAAKKLGIEAMKLVDNLRFDGSPYYPKLLPGETEE